MMVERTTLTRRSNRIQFSLPYARPPPRASQDKKSSLAFMLHGIISWFKTTNELDEDEPMEESEAGPSNSVAQALADIGYGMDAGQGPLPPPPRRGDERQPSQLTSQLSYPQLPGGPPPSQAPATTSMVSSAAPPPVNQSSTSPSPPSAGPVRNNIETVTTFLNNKLGQGQMLNTVEIAGIMTLLNRDGTAPAEEEEKREPFRFSTSPSTRGPSPASGGLTASASGPTNGEAKKPRMLTKNPNGVYRWQGAGSARPRNRYQSAGFGPSRSQPTIKLAPEKAATADAKRRRVGEDAQASTFQHTSGAAPATNGAPLATVTNGRSTSPTTQKSPPPQAAVSSSKTGGLVPPAAPRLRTAGITKPTAPAVPSPLRNSWSHDSTSPGTVPPRPTRAAALITDILKEVTPSEKKKDLINPYEALYPGNLKQLPKKKSLKRKSSSKEEAAKTAEKKVAEKKQKVEMTPVKIIEATVPKGAKRARPPPDLAKQKPAALAQESRKAEPLRPADRQTTSNGFALFPVQSKASAKPPVVVEEVSDEEQPSPPKKAKKTKVAVQRIPAFISVAGPAQPSAPTLPKPPVPTRSISIEEVEDQDMESESVVKPAQVIEPEESKRRSPSPTSPSSAAPAGPFNHKSVFPTKSSAPKAPSKLRYSIQPEKDEQMQDVAEKAEQEKSSTTKPPSPIGSTSAPFAAMRPARKQPTNVAEVKDFVKDLPELELTLYSFDIPMSSPGAGPSTLRAIDAAKATPVSELPSYSFDFTPVAVSSPAPAFNWGVAGAKKPAAAGDEWTCSMCMLKNPSAATEKCTICDAPRPGAAPKAAPKSFDFAAAGMKAQPASSSSVWTCSTCMLQNPDSAKEKCTVCDAPRPGAQATVPAAKGFDWAAAGTKAPPTSSAGTWSCGTCMLSNPDSATEKCTVCDAPRPNAKPAAPAPQGFNWAAAGMKQPTVASGWTCKVCMLQNASDAAKCSVCDEPR
ncbi:zf-RanBP domain-containing protein [Phanerochaete sordida]|uniref:Zf-RanBP domain-containing protein n=1 Tax=Phanerochaete sordida TaxID=48140 RepID=A0A9P3GAG0_9APHY|nr:zf-RanBP domain-containing protein [Phanerochaete sordida]